MQLKSNRGVQQEDVGQAADALIAEGLRPTIERVRQKIGRGSPNTVSPLLDVWFSTLAARLGLDGKPSGEGRLPEPVQQAASLLWNAALASARQEATEALAQAHQALATDRMALAQRESDFEQQKQVLLARQLASEETLQMTRHQLGEIAVRLEESSLTLERRERDIDTLREKLTQQETERASEQRRSEENSQRHAEERARLEARASANERRLLEELDRERQEVKRLKAATLEQERRAAAANAQWEAGSQILAARLQEKDQAFQSALQTLASAQSRMGELEDLLQAQKAAHAITLKQVDVLLLSASRKSAARPLSRRRI
ncbi:MAG: DNA-binding protein [Polaromonas sp.]|nr:DNA-binding protein [Polaromonas sp.]